MCESVCESVGVGGCMWRVVREVEVMEGDVWYYMDGGGGGRVRGA